MSLIENRKVRFNYEITETIPAGIELFGFEVKSLRNGQGSLEGSYVTVRGGEAFVIGMQIPAYQENNTPKEYDPLRNRRLLLNKKEIARLAAWKQWGEKKTELEKIHKEIQVKLNQARVLDYLEVN